ncbi:MAG: c-type cytochrome [Gemmatimonadetes bacterium]|nr:c-type cytochrome [Gemmatimonadota bacterium]
MRARSLGVLALAGLALPLMAAAYGGWAVITMDDLPEYVVAGRPVTLTFTVRQHGRTLLSGLQAEVEARAGGNRLRVAAEPLTESGRYRATLTLPQAGEWTFTVHSGFMNSRATLLPISAVEAGSRPVALTDTERGRRLFLAKGCFTCHLHREFNQPSVEVGPELTGTRLAANYIQNVLAHPETAPRSGNTMMPNLHLSEREVVALSAFLTAPSQAMR